MKETTQFFRANVGIVLANDRGLVLALERSDIPGAWQLPQGGVREGEEPLQAAYREVREETGIISDRLTLVDEYPDWLAYELPTEARSAKTGRGQAQKWFLFRLQDASEAIKVAGLGDEFSALQWIELSKLIDKVPEFRRRVYQTMAARFEPLLLSK